MGQKTNVLTLRKTKSKLNLLVENSKLFLYGFKFLKNFEKLLLGKGILLLEKTLNFENNQLFLTVTTFFRSSKTINYKRKGLKQKKSSALIFKNSSLASFINRQFFLFNSSLIVVNFKNLNKILNRRFVIYFFTIGKRFVGFLFNRRFNLFIDFLKLSAFFSESKVPSNSYLFVLGQIFRILPKRKHNRFLFFLKVIFTAIVETLPKNSQETSIKGIKFIVNGKLQGKTRADSRCIQVGSVPIQTISKNIDFSRLHVYTIYGAFGFQLWVHRELKSLQK